MRDLICKVISCCVSNCDTGKKQCMWYFFAIENQKKYDKEFLLKSLSKRWFSNGIHCLLRPADAREHADIIYHVTRIAILRVRNSYWRRNVGHPKNI